MKKTSLVIFMATIMVIGTVGTGLIPDAEAKKASGVGTSQYGSSTDICGLVSCSDYPGGKEAYKSNWFLMFKSPSTSAVSVETTSTATVETKKVYVSDHNADKEFPAKLDVFIHKFELDKMSAEDALEGIKETYQQYTTARISTDIIDGVGEKLDLYKKGTLNVEETIEAIHLTAEPQNVNPEYQGALDEVIHMFEKDKISADEAIDGIKETHAGFVDLYITSNLIEAVDETISLIDSGKLSGADAVEAVHLTAEPQNVNPEYMGALDEVLHDYELDGTSADDALAQVIEIHEGFTGLYITSEVIEDVGIQLNIYDTGNVSVEHVIHEIHEVMEDAELAAAAAMSDSGIPAMKELPPNHVDIPVGTGVPGCEVEDWCYMPADLHVHVGDTVTWVNSDHLPHTVTSVSPTGGHEPTPGDEDGLFDSGFMSGGDEWSYTFDTEGEYYYYCQLHPWMQGEVTVE